MIEDESFASLALISLTLTAGTAFLMWLGEQITDKGIGNGISILIFAGIVAAIPPGAQQIYQHEFSNAGDQVFLHIVKLVIILVGDSADRGGCHLHPAGRSPDSRPIRQARRRTSDVRRTVDPHPAEGECRRRDSGDFRPFAADLSDDHRQLLAQQPRLPVDHHQLRLL